MRKRWIIVPVAFAGIIGGLVGAGAAQVFDSGGSDGAVSAPAASSSTRDDSPSPQVAALAEGCVTATEIYEQVRPAVVQITASAGRSGGTGTGVVIDESGHILTNNHVISGARTIEVRFADGSTTSGTIVGTDPANDLAVVEVDPSEAPAIATIGDSDAVRPGDTVLAIGNPFNLEGTITQGIVSALDRTYATGGSTRPLRGMIQTDAAINPGNSGGPLLNCKGEVIGINTLLENPTGENVNVGVAFAVAINTAKNSLSEMVSGETVSHPWLGIAGVDVTPALAEELGLGTDSGVYVTVVSSGSPAADAGLEGAFASQNQAAGSEDVPPGGDVILSVDGQEVSSIEELAGYLDREKRPGESVELSVSRNGETLTLSAELANWPSSA
jgi:S1-C subfamily serine protease